MPYSVNWLIPDQVIFAHFSGETTEDDLRGSLISVKDIIESSDNQYVHLITDTGDVTKAVPSHKALQILREIGTHDRLGWNLIIRERSPLVKLGVALTTVLNKSNTRSLDSLEAAETFLKKMDESLDWENTNRDIVASG
ncbi:MAG: hypothetical protein KC615_22990 [Anaerolineae bacterium]|nr:hypothetical protein [Anaerolineae bacterium]MCB9458180.1 hypothetical protein [Anaerolineaceae bacterium]